MPRVYYVARENRQIALYRPSVREVAIDPDGPIRQRKAPFYVIS